jgi:hypothetical protein
MDRVETDLELAAGQSFFVDRKPQRPVLQERSAGIVPVPDAENVQVVRRTDT